MTTFGVDSLRDIGIWQLARMARCLDPNSDDSPGAKFLDAVRVNMAEAIEYDRFDPERESDSDRDVIHEIADQAPDTYTHTRWQEFIDLGAYQEDPEHGSWPDDLNNAAGVALYQIAEHLCESILEEWRGWWEEAHECEGHYPDPETGTMGETEYCDGSCRTVTVQ